VCECADLCVGRLDGSEWLCEVDVCQKHTPGAVPVEEREDDVELALSNEVRRRVVNELMDDDLTRAHRDDLLCVETVFIVREARVQITKHLAKCCDTIISFALTSTVVPVYISLCTMARASLNVYMKLVTDFGGRYAHTRRA
jgi:hypothetical protein